MREVFATQYISFTLLPACSRYYNINTQTHIANDTKSLVCIHVHILRSHVTLCHSTSGVGIRSLGVNAQQETGS